MTGEKDRKAWFPAKTCGWGWGFPCAWQGWVVMLAYIGAITGISLIVDPERQLWIWLGWIVGLTLLLLLVCWWKGEKPSWRWGGRGEKY